MVANAPARRSSACPTARLPAPPAACLPLTQAIFYDISGMSWNDAGPLLA
jgi:hypothetical protein